MQEKRITAVAVAMMMVGLAMTAGADEGRGKPNFSYEKGKITPTAQAVLDLSLAARLADYGRRAKRPMALITAAQIVKHAPHPKKKLKQISDDNLPPSDDVSSTFESRYDPDKLLAEAKSMSSAQGNGALASLAGKEGKIVCQRGRLDGATAFDERIAAEDTVTYEISFRADEYAAVTVIGDGNCSLELLVFDEHEILIARDHGDLGHCVVSFTPMRTGKFFIKIYNPNKVAANYTLTTN